MKENFRDEKGDIITDPTGIKRIDLPAKQKPQGLENAKDYQ